MADPDFVAGLRTIGDAAGDGAAGGGNARHAPDIVGVDIADRPVHVRIDSNPGPVLLAFLATRCDGCMEFWSAFRGEHEGASGVLSSVSVVVVTKGRSSRSAAGIAEVAAGVDGVPVVMSDDAWTDYRVLGYPHFILVDARTRTVVSETVGFGWSDVVGLVRSAGY